jgi:hypothetical protein
MNCREAKRIAERGIHMQQAHLIAASLGLLAVCIFAADASAYYHPTLGRFMGRDPGAVGTAAVDRFIPRDLTDGNQYANGLSLHQYVMSNPVLLKDPSGRNIYAIDGTWTSSKHKSNVKKFFDKGMESRHYWAGPSWGATGLDASGIFRSVKHQICTDYCKDPNITINLVGWSRGAVIAMEVAEELQDDGCCCNGKILYPRINWLGLFDAVDMTLTWGWANNITSNVDNASHVIKTKEQLLFPTVHAEAEDPTQTHLTTIPLDNSDHGDVGMRSEEALHWMIHQAQAAGVNMQHVPKNYAIVYK